MAKRTMSKSARKRIGDAQRKRWAEFKAKIKKDASNPKIQDTIIEQYDAQTAVNQLQSRVNDLTNSLDLLESHAKTMKHDLENNGYVFAILANALALRKSF